MRKFLIPEVVQSSALDCGPAALKSLLEGFGIPVSYGRLREACQTSIDGTSIDTMEAVANQLGLTAEQIMVPVDHLLMPESRALPALLVVQLPDGITHFVVVWRRIGNLLQIMDPAAGRRWVTADDLLGQAYRHRMAVPADGWREFAASDEFQKPLRRRMRNLGIRASAVDQLCRKGLSESSWRGIASLDAVVRLATSLMSANALANGTEAAKIIAELMQRPDIVPPDYWSVQQHGPDPSDGSEQVFIRGAVLVRVLGRRAEAIGDKPVCAELRAAAAEPKLRPFREFAKFAIQTGPGALALLALGLITSSAGVLAEALLFRSLLDLTADLHLAGQRIGAMAAIIVVSAALLLLDIGLTFATVRMARSVELRLRILFLQKIPKLGDRYFQSRLTSDMASRSHVLHHFRHLPDLIRQFAGAALKLCFTALALIWLEPQAWITIVLIAAGALVIPLLAPHLLAARDLRVRSHAGALTRFALDGMLGLITIRAHGLERALRSEQEKLLGSWADAALRLQNAAVRIEAVQLLTVFGLATSLLLAHPMQGAEVGRALLVIYWALNLPVYGQELCTIARNFPYYRSLMLRLLEPLGAPEETVEANKDSMPFEGPPSIEFRDVSVAAAGHSILQNINLQIDSGEHVAIVGPSGAGKSSLVGLLLGWSKPTAGTLEVNGKLVNYVQLRRSVAWVDPAVHIWNRSLFSNMHYGSGAASPSSIGEAIDAAMLRKVLESLPDGLQTLLGEGGAFLSGGEGQRVRLARALLRPDAEVVILDEPFRGLDREKRRELLARARAVWQRSTLLCITHDIDETLEFDRVIVVENGQIAEEGEPGELAANPESRYAALLEADLKARSGMWSGREWRRIRVQNGRLIETVMDSSELCEEAEVA